MKRGDLLVIAAVLLAAVLLAVFLAGKPDAVTAVVMIAGEPVARLSLDGSAVWLAEAGEAHSVERLATGEFLIRTGEGENLLSVAPDGAAILRADCASQDCVHTGRIARPGQAIACLPHRVMVALEGTPREGDVDAVAG